jgi:large subunit ribosomal protein L25
MSEYGNIEVTVRTGRGKGAARQLRRAGQIPAVLYGQGQDNIALAIDPSEFHKATDPEKQINTLFNLTIKEEGKPDVSAAVVVTELQRDVVRDLLTHIDFMRVDLGKEIVRKVPVKYSGKSIGVTKGGKLKTFKRHVKVAAKPAEVPVVLSVDVTPIDAGETVRVRDMSLPNARILDRADSPLALVEAAKAKKDEEGEEGEANKK